MSLTKPAKNRISKRLPRSTGAQRTRIVVANHEYGELVSHWVLALDKKRSPKLDVHLFDNWNEVTLRGGKRRTTTIFVSRLEDVADTAWKKAWSTGWAGLAARDLKYLLISEGLPIESVASRLARLGVRDPRRIHVACEEDEQAISKLLGRLVHGIVSAAETPSILDAWIEGENLVVLSARFDRLRVPLEKLEPYLGKNRRRAHRFEIDEDGRFLFWPHADAHLGWEELKQIVDPAQTMAAQKKTAHFNRRYGAAIRSLRQEAGLKQSAIHGLSERQLRRIEQGKQAVTSSALKALAKAHGMPIENYLKELAARCTTADKPRKRA